MQKWWVQLTKPFVLWKGVQHQKGGGQHQNRYHGGGGVHQGRFTYRLVVSNKWDQMHDVGLRHCAWPWCVDLSKQAEKCKCLQLKQHRDQSWGFETKIKEDGMRECDQNIKGCKAKANVTKQEHQAIPCQNVWDGVYWKNIRGKFWSLVQLRVIRSMAYEAE